MDNMGLESFSLESLRAHTLGSGSMVIEMSEDDDDSCLSDPMSIYAERSRLVGSGLVDGTMFVGRDGPPSSNTMFIGGAELLLTSLLVSLMTLGSSPRVDQPLSISLGKFDGTGVARPDVYFNNLTRVPYLPAPSNMPASLLDTSMVSGKGIVTRNIPVRSVAPFS